MKISEVLITDFKRFTDLQIKGISKEAKIVIIVGPNGSGKSSLFDALHRWYKERTDAYGGWDNLYYSKTQNKDFDYKKAVTVLFHDFTTPDYQNRDLLQGRFYFRSAYRNEADFTISSLTHLDDPTKKLKLEKLIQNDSAVSENYQRLVSLTIERVFNSSNDEVKIKDLRDELIGKVRKSLSRIFNDLTLSSIGDPLRNGTFYFEKGNSKDYHYKNLSGGEKAAFDLILDLIIKSAYFKEAIYCIDEPETHMHTALQASLFQEIYSLIPADSQLWINTHSFGILKKAKEIEKENPGTIAFISFDNHNFDLPVTITPSQIDKKIWERFIQLTLDDYSEFIVPRQVILCEGNIIGRKNKNFDADIYNKIFSEHFSDVLFISAGSCSEIENDNNPTYQMLRQVLRTSDIVRLIDCDDKNEEEIKEYKNKGIKILTRRHIESYLWDDEILHKICNIYNHPEKAEVLIRAKNEKMLESNKQRGHPSDDIKSASAQFYDILKKELNLTQSGSTKEAFLKSKVAQLITPDTRVYHDLKDDIFN